jgi:DNA-binding transcriptional regulator YdaS (Cro superfamily)
MTKDESIKLAGSVQALADLLGITRPAIYQWKKIPKLRVYQLKELRKNWFAKPQN